MKKTKRILAGLCAAVMATSVLTACSSKKSGSGSGNTASGSVGNAEVQSTKAPKYVEYGGLKFIVPDGFHTKEEYGYFHLINNDDSNKKILLSTWQISRTYNNIHEYLDGQTVNKQNDLQPEAKQIGSFSWWVRNDNAKLYAEDENKNVIDVTLWEYLPDDPIVHEVLGSIEIVDESKFGS